MLMQIWILGRHMQCKCIRIITEKIRLHKTSINCSLNNMNNAGLLKWHNPLFSCIVNAHLIIVLCNFAKLFVCETLWTVVDALLKKKKVNTEIRKVNKWLSCFNASYYIIDRYLGCHNRKNLLNNKLLILSIILYDLYFFPEIGICLGLSFIKF